MASIFKRKDRSQNRRSPYWIEYFDHLGKRRRRKGFTDYELTQQLAGKLENEVMLRKRGMLDPQAEKLAEHRRRPIAEHLKAFENGMIQRGTTGKHVKLTMTRVQAVIDGCRIKSLADLQPELVQLKLNELRVTGDLGHKTYNHYVQAIDSFARWLVRAGRLASNPLHGLARLNNEVDVRHERRALNSVEMAKLIDSARSSAKRIQGYDGEQRARVYQLSYLTGLRRSELASLTRNSFKLTGDNPTLTVDAACSKHRRTDVLPLHPDLVSILPTWLAGKKPTEKLFPKLERKKTWLMVKLDLERVGIPYETADGVADFHASGRHSYVTGLLRHGATLTEAKELARHSDVRMTMRYTHIGLNDQAKALAALPGPTSKPAAPADQKQKRAATAGQQSGQHSSGPTRQTGAKRGTTRHNAQKNPEASSTAANGTYDASGQSVAESGTDSAEWRRRESNPRPVMSPERPLRV